MGNYLALGVGNNLAPPLGNSLALTASRLGNYLAFDNRSAVAESPGSRLGRRSELIEPEGERNTLFRLFVPGWKSFRAKS